MAGGPGARNGYCRGSWGSFEQKGNKTRSHLDSGRVMKQGPASFFWKGPDFRPCVVCHSTRSCHYGVKAVIGHMLVSKQDCASVKLNLQNPTAGGVALWALLYWAPHLRLDGRKPHKETGRQRKVLFPWTSISQEAQVIQFNMLAFCYASVFLICVAENQSYSFKK